MTRLKAFITALFIAQLSFCQDRMSIGWNIAEAARNGNADIRTGYAFSGHWSAEAHSSFRLFNPTDGAGISDRKRLSGYGMAFRYWPGRCFEGASLAFGAAVGFRLQPDMTLNAGYSLTVWKCIGIDIGYTIMVFDSIRNDLSDEMSIEICIRF